MANNILLIIILVLAAWGVRVSGHTYHKDTTINMGHRLLRWSLLAGIVFGITLAAAIYANFN